MTSFGYNILGFGSIEQGVVLTSTIFHGFSSASYTPPAGVRTIWMIMHNGYSTGTSGTGNVDGWAGRTYAEKIITNPSTTTVSIANAGGYTSAYGMSIQNNTGYGWGSQRLGHKNANNADFYATGGNGGIGDASYIQYRGGGGGGGSRLGPGLAGTNWNNGVGAGGGLPTGNENSGVINSQQYLELDFIYNRNPSGWIGANGMPKISDADAAKSTGHAQLQFNLNQMNNYGQQGFTWYGGGGTGGKVLMIEIYNR